MLEIAIAHDVSSALVRRRAKQEGWTSPDAESKQETRLSDVAS